MLPAIPKAIFVQPDMRPVLDLLNDNYLTPKEVATRWRYGSNHLSNLRRAQKGPPWFALPSGGIRYRASDIIGAELAGTCGPLTLDNVLIAVAGLDTIDGATKDAVITGLRKAIALGK